MSEENEARGSFRNHADALEFTSENSAIVTEIIRNLSKIGKITYRKIHDKADINKDLSTLWRWVQNKSSWSSIGKNNYLKIIDFLVREGLWYHTHDSDRRSTDRHRVFHLISDFLDIGNITANNTKRRTAGSYRVYHPSTLLSGQYVVGAALIKADRDSPVVEIREYYKYEPKIETSLEIKSLEENYDGYVFRKQDTYFTVSRDRFKSHIRKIVLPTKFVEDEEIVMLKGFIVGTSENKNIVLPILFYKTSEGSESENERVFSDIRGEANIYEKQRVPPIITEYLDSIPSIII